jgi:hypothetical protein
MSRMGDEALERQSTPSYHYGPARRAKGQDAAERIQRMMSALRAGKTMAEALKAEDGPAPFTPGTDYHTFGEV